MLVNVFFLIPRRSVIKNFEFTPSRSTTREVKMTSRVLADYIISKSAVNLGKQVIFHLPWKKLLGLSHGTNGNICGLDPWTVVNNEE
jgi:hypothetical protein